MIVYVYGASQSSQVIQLTVPCSYNDWISTEKQLSSNCTNTNHVLLYNNRRIDQKVSLTTLSMQVPDFASVIYSVLWVKVVEKRMKWCFWYYIPFIIDITLNLNIVDECISCGEDADVFCTICQFVSVPAVIPVMNCGILTGWEETTLSLSISAII